MRNLRIIPMHLCIFMFSIGSLILARQWSWSLCDIREHPNFLLLGELPNLPHSRDSHWDSCHSRLYQQPLARRVLIRIPGRISGRSEWERESPTRSNPYSGIPTFLHICYFWCESFFKGKLDCFLSDFRKTQGLTPKPPQRNKDPVRCAALGVEVTGPRQEQLMQTLIVRLLKMHLFSLF